MNTQRQNTIWRAVCTRGDLVANSGVVALLDGEQVALFYLPCAQGGLRIYAIGNRDPRSGANVIGRGIVGHLAGHVVVASPLYKQHFRLDDGGCMEDEKQTLPVWPVRCNGDTVEVAIRLNGRLQEAA